MVALGVGACATTSGALYDSALAAAARGDTAAALAYAEQDVARHPDDLRPLRLLIRLHGVAGDLGAAERAAERLAARLGPGHAEPYVELGHAYELAHRFEEALALYDRAASEAPRDAIGPRAGGLRAAHWGEAALAEPRLAEAVRRGADDVETWHALALARARLGDGGGARAAYLRCVARDAQRVACRLGLASLAVRGRDWRAALAAYDAVLQVRPGLADAQLGRAFALMELGDLDAARQALDAAEAGGADRVATARSRGRLEQLSTAAARPR